MNRIIIDVREPHEFEDGHTKGSINIPLSKLATSKEISEISKDSEIIVYCNSGNRSDVAFNLLRQKGFNNVINGINQQQISAKFGM